MNPRLKNEPDYNLKRRKGTGTINLATCDVCGYRIPENLDTAYAQAVPCSAYHVRCVRCQWPVAWNLISPLGLCVSCSHLKDRRAYHKKSQKET